MDSANVTFVPVDYDPFASPEASPQAEARAPSGAASGAASLAPVDHNPFEETPEKQSGNIQNFAAGANGVVYTLAGGPVDGMTWLMNKVGEHVNALHGTQIKPIEKPILGSQWLADAFKNTIGTPRPEDIEAKGPWERAARAAGAGTAGAVMPMAVVGVLGEAGMLTPAAMRLFGSIFGEASSPGAVAQVATMGGAGGTIGSLAGQAVEEAGYPQYAPLADLAGNIIGAGGVAAIEHGTSAGLRAGQRAVSAAGEFIAPMTRQGQERLAGQVIRNAADDPETLMASLNNKRTLVAGSEPTTFQQTGDMGIGQLEKVQANRDPQLFAQRRADQNAARVSTLNGMQEAGHPEAVVTTLRANLADLDAQTNAAITDATTKAQEAASRLGGVRNVEDYGAQMRSLADPVADQARARAQQATEAMGGTERPEAIGVTTRAALSEARAAVKAREKALWNAVDPDGTLALGLDETKARARGIMEDLPSLAAPMEGAEAGIFNAAINAPDVVPFRELQAFRSRVSEVMREELSANGQTQMYARLAQLRNAIQEDIETVVAGKAAQEQGAVVSGAMREEDTMAAKLFQETNAWRQQQAGHPAGMGNTFGPDVPTWDEGAVERLKTASAATKERAQTYDEGPVGQALASAGAMDRYKLPDSAVPGKFFRPGRGGGESVAAYRQAVGDEAAMAGLEDYAASELRRAAMRPDGTLDPARADSWIRAHSEALRAFPALEAKMQAAAATAKGLDEGMIFSGRLADSDLPKRVFKPGEGGYEAVNAFLDAVGRERGLEVVRDYAIRSLREAALRDDGTLDPYKVAKWLNKNSDALRVFPDLRDALKVPTRASEYIADVAKQRTEALATYQKGTVGKLLNLDSPDDVVRTVGSIFGRQDAATQMGRLAQEVAGNPDAKEGLRKAVVDCISGRYISNTEAATTGLGTFRSDGFQTFVLAHEAALGRVFSKEEVANLTAIAEDLQRANRSIAALKAPGGSDTVQNLMGEARHGQNSVLSLIMTNVGAVGAGSALGGQLGAAVGVVGAAVVNPMRTAGLQTVGDLVTDALLNPERARYLLQKVTPTKARSPSMQRMGRALYRQGAAIGSLVGLEGMLGAD